MVVYFKVTSLQVETVVNVQFIEDPDECCITTLEVDEVQFRGQNRELRIEEDHLI